MRRICAFFVSMVLIFSISSLLFGQDDFDNWKETQKQVLRQYKSEQDKAFVEFLEKNWESFKAFKGEIQDETPKPVEAPVAEVKDIEFPEPKKAEEVKVEKINIQVEEQEEKESMVYVNLGEGPRVDVNFLGLPIEINYQDSLSVQLDKPINQKNIANFWYVASNTEYETFLQQLQEFRTKLSLNDWGYCLLLNEIGKEITNDSHDLTNLFLWFMLTKSGYESKVGFSGENVFLLLPCKNKMFGVSYIMVDEKKFYTVSFDKKQTLKISISTYDGKYPDADDLIDLSITESPKVKTALVEKELSFTYEGVVYKIPVKYNQNAAEFFKNYPQTSLKVYFNAPLSPEATYSLSVGLKPVLDGKTEAEAANVLLRFVQTAFEYKTDGDQFGEEKSFFGDETLFYPYSDCEDRSIIFSYLIRQLLQLDVLGLDYPGHISTAVKFGDKIAGDYIIFHEDEYIICDPTYINANLGMAMPKFKDVKPKIIDLTK
ncbi:MAG: hypothetical protein H8E11_00775 [Candidatus Cloacimonetes bacterium]|nr:hypothetical protein [Candidatus Cloacimonadota bacterium]